MIVLVLGGTRSGKSEVAETIAARLSEPVTYVAMGEVTDGDIARRIAVHRARRPAAWNTVERPIDIVATLREVSGTVLLDSTGTLVTAAPDFAVDTDALCGAMQSRHGDTVVVGEEVGMSVHAPSEVGRRFVDAVGACNRAIAAIADHVLLVAAGRVARLLDTSAAIDEVC